jgi:hypothetical protein
VVRYTFTVRLFHSLHPRRFIPAHRSSVKALHLICDEWLWCAIAFPGAIPKHLRNLRASLKTLILPLRRTGRHYPRAVKLKMSNYPRKRRR